MTDLEKRALIHIIRAAKHPSRMNSERLKKYGKELNRERKENEQ